MALPVFKQLDPLRLYELQLDDSAQPLWAGYYPGPQFTITPETYISTTWQDQGGTYLFLAEMPASNSTFYTGLTQLLQNLSPTANIRILWIYNPNDTWQQWQYDYVKANASGTPGNLLWTLAQNASFSLGGYVVQINGGTSFTLSNAYTMAISFPAEQVSLTTPGGSLSPQGTNVNIPLWGKVIGSFQMYLTLTDSDFENLGVIMRYGIVTEPSKHNPFGGVEMLDMPPFALPSDSSLELLLSFSHLAADDPDRCYLSFYPFSNTSPPTFNAGFTTTQGATTTLTPLFQQTPFYPARLVFNKTPTTDPDGGTPADYEYHITPDGLFALEITNQPLNYPIQLINGLSAQEYIQLPATKAMCFFEAGKPAFKGGQIAGQPTPNISTLFTDSGTTAHLCIITEESAGAGVYFAQSNQAALYKTDGTSDFLGYHSDMPIVTMPTYVMGTGNKPATYAMGCFNQVLSSQADLAQQAEANAISLFRRYQIGNLGTPPPTSVNKKLLTDPLITYTPSGLKATLSADGKNWSSVQIANMQELTSISVYSNNAVLPQPVIYVDSTDGFPSSGTFTVQIGDTVTTVSYTGVTSGSFTGCTGGTGTLTTGNTVTSPILPVTLPVGPNFQQVLQSNQVFFVASNAQTFMADSAGTYSTEDIPNIVIADWPFEISPKDWRSDSGSNPTMMIFKYCNRSLKDMAGDTRCWSWPEAAEINGTLSATQQALQSFIQQPSDPDPENPLNEFYNDVVNNPDWNGFLFLNITVPLNSLPPQIEGLAAGIDASLFFGHHIGVNLSPLRTSGGTPVVSPSSFFGFINYNASPETDADMPTGTYEFQVDELKVVFANSQIRTFESKIQITLNQLFGETSTTSNKNVNNNIFLNGTYQHHNGQSTYIFKSNGDTLYNISSPTLQSIDISGAQFVTLIPKGGLGSYVHTRFIFSGTLSFNQLTEVDLFSYQSLPFDNMWLDMSFDINNPVSSRVFQFDVSALTFRQQGKVLHAGAPFAAQFPIILKGLVYSAGSGSNVAKGYLDADMPDSFSGVTDTFYGLLYDLSLGTMGGLAPKKAFTAQILLCWTPQANYTPPKSDVTYPAELKMKLPFTGSDGKDMLNIEGIIKLGLEGIQLFAADSAYTIKLRDFGLHILSVTLPPSGTTDIFLFGDPNGGGSALAWYAAYNKNTSNSQFPYSG